MPNRIKHPIKFGNTGKSVADLHKALNFLKYKVDGTILGRREMQQKKFGRSTRRVVLVFQTDHKLTRSGTVNKKTADQLNAELEKKGYFGLPEDKKPKIGREALAQNLLAPETLKINAATLTFIQNRLDLELKEHIVQAFDEPSEALQTAIHKLDLKHQALKDRPLEEIIWDEVLPALEEDETLAEEIEAFTEDQFSEATATVAELLELEKPIVHNAIFSGEVRQERNRELGRISGLTTAKREQLIDVELDPDDDELWEQLITEKVITKAQRPKLEYALQFARLTEDNLELTEKLVAENPQSTVTLVKRGQDEWVQYLKANKIKSPAGENLEAYAEKLRRKIERAHPTPYFMHRVAERDRGTQLGRIKNVGAILDRNEALFTGPGILEPDLEDIPDNQKKEIEESAIELQALANNFRHLQVPDILEDKTLSVSGKENAVQKEISLVTRFYQDNPKLDLSLAQFLPVEDEEDLPEGVLPKFGGIPEQFRLRVRKQLMAYQRTLQLTDEFVESEALLSAGFDSAAEITRLSLPLVKQRLKLSGESVDRIYVRAMHRVAVSSNLFRLLDEEIRGGRNLPQVFKHRGVRRGRNRLHNLFKDLDGYDDLFGSQDYCVCDHCRSVLSPAAYFVDLMEFIEEHIIKRYFRKGAKNHLLNLKIRRPDLWTLPLTCENTNTLIPYLQVVNEVLVDFIKKRFRKNMTDTVGHSNIYRYLSEVTDTFQRPFNRWLAALRLYLSHFQMELADLYALFDLPVTEINRERLGISLRELEALKETRRAEIFKRLSLSNTANGLPVKGFLRGAAISRKELDVLQSLSFVKADGQWVIKRVDEDFENQTFTEYIAPENVTKGWARLHLFIRLWKKLDWSLHEFNLVCEALDFGSDLTDKLEQQFVLIARLHALQQATELPLEELLGIVYRIPSLPASSGKPDLFARLFNEQDQLAIRHPDLDNGTTETPSADFAILQAGLGIQEEEIIQLIRHTFRTNIPDSFALEELSLLYGYTRLSRVSGLALDQLLLVEALQLGPENRTCLGNTFRENIENVSALLELLAIIESSPFSLADWWLLTTGEERTGMAHLTGKEQVIDFIRDVQKAAPLFFSGDLLGGLNGISEEMSVQILEKMLAPPLSLLIARETNDGRIYHLSDRYREEDLIQLADQFSITGELQIREAFSVNLKAIGKLLGGFQSESVLNRLPSYLQEYLGVSQVFFEALEPFRQVNPPDGDLLRELLLPPADVLDISGESVSNLLAMMQELERLQKLFTALELTEAHLPFILSHQELFQLAGALPEIQLPALIRLHQYSVYAKLEEDFPTGLHFLLDQADQKRPLTEENRAFLAGVLDIDLALTDSLRNAVPLPGNAFDALGKLISSAHYAKKTGLNGSALRQLTRTGFNHERDAAKTILSAIKARYEEHQWEAIVQPYTDRLNALKRDYLMEFVLVEEFVKNQRVTQFRDSGEILSYFLLDPKMESCARISRLKAATLSLQLYIHRCRMNLEQSFESEGVHVKPESIPDEQWSWRKNYRVWEANRKVFLYPENWIEPYLRDDKTSVFVDIENEFLQGNLSDEAINKMYRKYLVELGKLDDVIIISSYFDAYDRIYYFFGRTKAKPYQYYWRIFKSPDYFSEWKKIDLAIPAPYVSGVIYLGKLYLFWVNAEVKTGSTEIEFKEKKHIKVTHKIGLRYSFLNEGQSWNNVTEVKGLASFWTYVHKKKVESKLKKHEKKFHHSYWKCFPGINKRGQLVISYIEQIDQLNLDNPAQETHTYKNYVQKHVNLNNHKLYRKKGPYLKNGLVFPNFISRQLVLGKIPANGSYSEARLADIQHYSPSFQYNHNISKSVPSEVLYLVGNRPTDGIARVSQQQFLLATSFADYGAPSDPEGGLMDAVANRRQMVRLSTSIIPELSRILSFWGVDALLSIKFQKLLAEQEAKLKPKPSIGPQLSGKLVSPHDPSDKINFNGAFGPYLRELYFHLPFLMANYLNSIQKFEKADHWYRKIFDPTAAENPKPDNPTDRNWQYIEFRDNTLPSLKKMLMDSVAIEQYELDPFNPHAIARLRPLAYQKAIVMKYIDNLLDWGDHLFARDTFESINEALMLYIMAADILGERPMHLGKCNTLEEDELTYVKLKEKKKNQPIDFWIELENLPIQLRLLPDRKELMQYVMARRDHLSFSSAFTRRISQPEFRPIILGSNGSFRGPQAGGDTVRQRVLAFCIPSNEKLHAYWDRVEDRLFKIRNCMNIEGVRRQLALFQPPIDPALLVRARAQGLSVEDILSMLQQEPPAYRFVPLAEKARQFIAAVQSFGTALLSALERKDNEELLLLRAVQEQNILSMMEKVKTAVIDEAKEQVVTIEKSIATVETRKDYYSNLVNTAKDNAFGMNDLEQQYLDNMEQAKGEQVKAMQADQSASLFYTLPDVTAGIHAQSTPPYAYAFLTMSFGLRNIAAWCSSDALKFRKSSTTKSLGASQTATKSQYLRRKEEWTHQVDLVSREIEQLEQQKIVAEARQGIAQKDLDVHRAQINQSKETHDFYKGKLTNVGLYTYLSNTLNRLYRTSYNMAFEMAKQAGEAYRFETDDHAFFIRNDNWQAGKAGLLAGERLLLQLQQMEIAYLEKNKRDFEITQAFSLLQWMPQQLIRLKDTGDCTFLIPEEAFDLVYPGYFKRRIKSVRLTIPCITGPYVNVNCKLTQIRSMIRRNPTTSESDLVAAPISPTSSIATSRASNDGGVFELNFRDERYLPFEGSGAISEWSLSLPHQFRSFDYHSISDVIVHISYTASFDGGLRRSVENELAESLNTLIRQAGSGSGLSRLFSLKHEFADTLHDLLHPNTEGEPATLQLDARHYPYWLMGRELEVSGIECFVVPKAGQVAIQGVTLRLNAAEIVVSDVVHAEPGGSMTRGVASGLGSQSATGAFTLQITDGRSAVGALDNMFLLFHYRIR